MIRPLFYIFTGGPGSGKTTLLAALEEKGYDVMPEVGRAIIQREKEKDSDILPWKSKQLFYEAMLAQSVSDYHSCSEEEVVLWDRGIIDSIGYAVLEKLDISAQHLAQAKALAYQHTVFILPPWEEIYTQDKERKQDIAVAIQTCKAMKETYQQMGYTLVEVPKGTIEERVNWVVEVLNRLEDERNNRNR